MPAKVKSDFKEEEILQAVIIADTFDNKLHPLTLDTPKVLIPFLNVPLIEYVLEALLSSGIQETVIFCCNHSNQVRSYLSNSKWNAERSNMKVRLIISDNCHSMGDALRDIGNKDVIRSDFVLLHGDTIFNTSLFSALKIHKDRKQQDKNITLTMIIKEVGIDEPLKMDDKFLLLQEQEQRILNSRAVDNSCNTSKALADMHANVSTAHFNILDCQISICSPVVLHLMIDNFDYQSISDLVKGILVNEEVLGNSIYYHMLKKNEYASRVWGFQSYETVALDVLNRWTYPLVMERNIVNLEDDKYSFNDKNIYLHDSFNNSEKCKLVKNVVIGRNSVIGKNTLISNSVIGSNCKIGNNVTMENCFLFSDVIIEDGCKLTKCFISDFVHVEKNVIVPKGCVFGNHVKVFLSDSLSFNTRLVSISMSDSLEALSSKKGGYVYFTHKMNSPMDNNLWDWGEIVDESDESSFGESDSEDEEYDDSKLCYNEFIKNLKRSIDENISMQNVILEMNSAKHAYGIQIRELHILLMRALLDLPNKFPSYAPENTNYFSRFVKMMKYFLPLLRHYIKSKEAERDVLVAMEEACEMESDALKSFVAIAKFLYDEDILSEDEITAWWKDDTIEHIPGLEDKVAPFINWLETADEDSSDESD